MTFHDLVQHVLEVDTLGVSLWAFRPELALCATILVLLLARMVAPGWRNGAVRLTLVGTIVALYLLVRTIPESPAGPGIAPAPQPIFTGLLVFDSFSIVMRELLLLFVGLFAVFTWLSGVPGRDDATEFYVLVLGAALGMCLMVSANHVVIVFLGVEMASVPSYVLAGFLRHRRSSSEAALKYAVFGAAASGVMLYGISLLVGVLGSAHLPTMAAQLAGVLQNGAGGDAGMVLVLGGLMLMVGLAFKLSAVPFHFWTPDVFEGATAEVAAFLSIASKAAALGLLVRLAIGFGYVDRSWEVAFQQRHADAGGEAAAAGPSTPEAAGKPLPSPPAQPRAEAARRPELPAAEARPLLAALRPARTYIAGLIGLLAAITCTFGNLAAYGQTNIKRLLAYSTIAQAGYMMMPVAAAVAMIGRNPPGTQDAIASLVLYVAIYLLMNLGAFAVVAFLRNVLHSEQIADYAGLVRRSPGLAVCMSIVMFSLVGLPPLAGFAAKFAVFAALFDARLIALLVIGGLNTVLSLFYYLRVVRVMVLAPEPESRPAPEIRISSIPGAFCAAVTLPLVVLFVFWDGLFSWAEAAASVFRF